MGNKPILKPSPQVSIVMDQFLKLLHACGLPKDNVDLLHADGEITQKLIENTTDIIKLTQFTGSSDVAEKLLKITNGKVKIEDAGFDFKILGNDSIESCKNDLNYVSYVCDQDAYAGILYLYQ